MARWEAQQRTEESPGKAEAARKRQGCLGLLKGTQVGVQSPYPGRRGKRWGRGG